MDGFLKDLRYSARTLLRNPGFTAAAVLTLTLGIGATSAIFSVVDEVLLQKLPYPDPERLVTLWNTAPRHGLEQLPVSEPEMLDYARECGFCERLAGFASLDASLSGTGQPERLVATRASADLFQILGVKPVVGRTFLPEEDRAGNDHVALLGHGLWQRRFGSDPGIVGRTIHLNAESYTVVGVAPPGFDFPGEVELWVPLGLDPSHLDIRGARYIQLLGRLRSGVTPEQARSEAAAAAARLRQQAPGDYPAAEKWDLNVIPLQELRVAGIRPALRILFAAVGLVLLISCANVANLILARVQARHREVSIRTALGASRQGLVRQFLVEGLLLGVLGGACGLVLAHSGMSALLALYHDQLPWLKESDLDSRVVLFTLAISLLTGLAVSLVPAFRASRSHLADALNDGGARASGGVGVGRFRNALVIAEVALSVVLLISAGLLIKNLLRLQETGPGFQPAGLLTFQVALPEAKYVNGPQVSAFYDGLLERLERLPNVRSVAFTHHLPLGQTGLTGDFYVEAPSAAEDGIGPESHWNWISPGYFRTMGVPLGAGRDFLPSDRDGSLPVVIVDQDLARTLWPGQNPLGRRIRLPGGKDGKENPWRTVVGVVGKVRQAGLDGEARAQLYVPRAQEPDVSRMYVVIRTSSDPIHLAQAARQAVVATDPDQPVHDLMTMEDRISESLSSRRFATLLISLFAGLALVLAVVGIYGVMAYSVSQRNHEIGIRLALGARPVDVLGLVVRQGMLLALLGLVIGVPAAFAATRLLESLLYQVSTRDPIIFGLVPLLLATAALLANYIPARRATGVNPMVAFRDV